MSEQPIGRHPLRMLYRHPAGRGTVRQDNPVGPNCDDRQGALQHALRTQLNNIVSYAELLLYDADRAGDSEFADELSAIEREGRRILELVTPLVSDVAGEATAHEAAGAAAKALADSIRRRVWRLQGSPMAGNPQVASDLQRIGSSAQRLAALLRSVISGPF